jgi:hypothetical protein
MKVVEFFRRYGNVEHVEVFRGEDLPAGVPERAGIYAWYARIGLAQVHRERTTSVEALGQLVSEEVVARLRRQPYRVEVTAALEPAFKGRLDHVSDVPDFKAVASLPPETTATGIFDFLSGPFAPFFSSPLYVGKAIRQPLSERIAQHLDGLHTYLGKNTEFLNAERRRLLEAETDPDDEVACGHSFALEAAVRQISQSRLLLVTYAPPVLDTGVVSALEHLLNRLVFPLCGRR